ncbi:MAG: hypothetical protein HYT40_02390 [Candidatus Sungbacteria bacterium]|uniref:Sortase n=1 Tax=Candidatus Sungiibacteriota bacterium TaxID=2750080 RepID=A0A931SBR2_9BACT|nr:hypothetical protein [Candidatus Sungbacteria bacterium]
MSARKPQLLRGDAKQLKTQAAKAPEKDAAVYVAAPARFSKTFYILWFMSFAVLFSTLYTFGFIPDRVGALGEGVKSGLRGGHVSLLSATLSTAKGEGVDEVMPDTKSAYSSEPRLIIENIGLSAKIVTPASTDDNILNTALTKGAVYYPGSGKLGEVGNVFLFGHSTGLAVVDDAHIDLATTRKLLTISTCRIFGGREDRYVVEAEFMKSYPLTIP